MPTGRKCSFAMLHAFEQQSRQEQHLHRLTPSGALVRAGGFFASSAISPLTGVACQMAPPSRKPLTVGTSSCLLAWQKICSGKLSYHLRNRERMFTFTPTPEPWKRKGRTEVQSTCMAHASRRGKEMLSPHAGWWWFLPGSEITLSIRHALSVLTKNQKSTPELRESLVCCENECHRVIAKLLQKNKIRLRQLSTRSYDNFFLGDICAMLSTRNGEKAML